MRIEAQIAFYADEYQHYTGVDIDRVRALFAKYDLENCQNVLCQLKQLKED